jgi:transcriptional regulator of acetoin/glycerol metabolism
VFGPEHYAEQLGDLAGVGVPIRHPVSGKVIGAVNLTCWRKDAGRLLIALAQGAARQVTQGLLNDSSAEEFQLLREYLRACRHTGGFVFALTNDMVLMNDQARDTLDPGDQAALLGRAAEALAGDHPGLVDVELPSGARARMGCRPLRGKGRRRLVGGVVHVRLLEPASGPAAAAGAGEQACRFGPALVGSGPLWLRGCRQVEAACASREWLSVPGEPGTGKLALLRAVCRHRNPAGTFHVLDAAQAGDHDWMVRALGELLKGEGSLVIRHVDRLSTLRLHALQIALEQALAAGRQQVLWVAVTLSQGRVSGDLAVLLTLFPGAVELAGQHRAALAGPETGRPAPAHRDDPSR